MTNLSLARRKWIGVALVSLIPFLIFVNYIYGFYIISLPAMVILSILVFLGWCIISEVFSSVSKMYNDSKNTLIAIGENIPSVDNEVNSLDNMISLLSSKVKDGLEQMKDFSRVTGELNKEVSKKVLIFSTILQANDLFSKNSPGEEVVKFLVEHLQQLLEAKFCFCGLKESSLGEIKIISAVSIKIEKLEEFISSKKTEFSNIKKTVLIDKDNKHNNNLFWTQNLDVINFAIIPIFSKGEVIGMVGIGNDKECWSFSSDDKDVLNLFSKDVGLVWEHERLSTKIEELEIRDYLTNLYNEKMIVQRLDEEIRRATVYQRPCGFIVMKIDNYDEYQKKFGLIESEKILKQISVMFKHSLRAIDIAGRIKSNIFGAILMESNKRQSQEMAITVKESLIPVFGDKVQLTFSVAASPINGITAAEIMTFALTNDGASENK
ncbi:MAG: diguanylate cyclase [Candidatus Omnitrophica bacterium]|nr:diguanylate cyclase [Candidatus Omnitrophota bacterium]